MANTNTHHDYNIVYRQIDKSGLPSLSYSNIAIKAKNEQEAILKLKAGLFIDGIFEIRIDQIKNVTPTDTTQNHNKKTKSLLGWIAGGAIVVASLAKFINNLI